MKYTLSAFLEAVDDTHMPVSTKLLRDSLLEGTHPGRDFLVEATSPIKSIDLVKEKYGYGVSVIQADGHEYRYAADEKSDKYSDPQKLLAAARKLRQFKGDGFVFGWLHRNAVLYYGSKKDANVKTSITEAVSEETIDNLASLYQDKYSNLSEDEARERAVEFLERFEIQSDRDYYNKKPLWFLRNI